MNAYDLAARIGARVLTPALAAPPVAQVYAGDRMSDLVSQAGCGTLLVTNLDGTQLLQVAHLMDAPAVCFVNGLAPKPELIAGAARQGTALLVSPFGLYETCGRIFAALNRSGEVEPFGVAG